VKTDTPSVRTGIFVVDLHHPHHTKDLWENILKLSKELKLDYFVFGGDNLNMDSIDHWLHDNGDRRHLEGKRLLKEYKDFQDEILSPIEKVLPSYCRKIWLNGNHEQWLEKYIDKIPELEGFAEIEKNLNLKDWEIYEYGKTSKIGKIYFHHGEYVNKYSAAKTVDTYNRNIVYGHGHTMQTYTHIAPIDSECHSAWEIPCACEMNPEYMRNRPNTWVNGFGIFYIQDNGLFNLYPVVAVKGHFVWNGVYF
jgi:hypothetical protein